MLQLQIQLGTVPVAIVSSESLQLPALRKIRDRGRQAEKIAQDRLKVTANTRARLDDALRNAQALRERTQSARFLREQGPLLQG
jgi:hypothetical protein